MFLIPTIKSGILFLSIQKQRLEDSELNQEKLESSIKVLMEEKEELAMQLTDALLAIEEERAIWSAKEKDALLAIEEQAKSNNEQITSLSTELSEVRNELESYREECKTIQERFTISSENLHLKEKFRENILELDQLETIGVESKQSHEISKAKFEMLSLEHELHCCPVKEEIQREVHVFNNGDNLSGLRELKTASEFLNEFQDVKSELSTVTKERDKLATQIEDQLKHVMEMEFLQKHCQDELSKAKVHIEELTHKISSMDAKMRVDGITNNKETSKLRMRLRGTQAKLEAFRVRYKEVVDESILQKIRYGEASGKLKHMLASQGLEVLNLKKQLATTKGQ